MHEEYLRPTEFIDSDSPVIKEFAEEKVQGATTDVEKAIKLYYAVRDGIYYDPYRIDATRNAFKASVILKKRYGYCVAKAIVLAAACRAQGIPCRLHFADVRNHLTTERLRKIIQTDTFYYHGYNGLFLEGAWVKVTPTFNKSLCSRFGVPPLDFDGVNDAVFQPFDSEGKRYMEYVADHGIFADVPYDAIIETFRTCYGPFISDQLAASEEGAFEQEAAAERNSKG